MKVYKFVFTVGILNLCIPFLGIPTTFKQYGFIALGVVSILYALIVRTIVKEQESGLTAIVEEKVEQKSNVQDESKTIEDVVEMNSVTQKKIIMSDVNPVRRGRKPKVLVQEEMYE